MRNEPDVYKDKLFAFLEAREENMIADLKEFVRIPSISTDLAEVRRALDYALSLGENGFQQPRGPRWTGGDY